MMDKDCDDGSSGDVGRLWVNSEPADVEMLPGRQSRARPFEILHPRADRDDLLIHVAATHS